MTIEESSKVDGMGIDRQIGEVVLLISDHLAWDDEQIHFQFLQSKIESYIQFIKFGQILETLPESNEMPAKIKLVCKHKPGAGEEAILRSIDQQLRGIGISFSFECLPQLH